MKLHGKRTRKPLDCFINISDRPEYGNGTYATISVEYNKYIYCIYDKGYKSTYCVECNTHSLPFYTSFNTLEETKEHIINNFGGTWKWSNI